MQDLKGKFKFEKLKNDACHTYKQVVANLNKHYNMKYKNTFFYLFLLIASNIYSQNKEIEIFGNLLTESIMKNDSTSFQSLILPKEAIIEKFKSKIPKDLSKEEIESAIKNINENYDEYRSYSYGLSFLNLTNKTGIFNLDLNSIKYDIVEIEETKKDTSFIAIHGTINHEKFSHFTFIVSNFNGKLYLASHLINISEVNKFEERKNLKKVILSSDEKGNLIAKGKIELENKTASKEEILDCILNSSMTIGIEETSKTVNNKLDFEFIKGKWQYTYYVNNSSDFAGIVEFKYEFKIFNGNIDYRYYDFIHYKDDSEFKSIGQLPFEITESILNVFTKEQYNTIISDIYMNQVLAIKRTKQYTDKCFE